MLSYLLILAIALAVGLDVGLTLRPSGEPSVTSPTYDTTSSSTVEPAATPTDAEPLQSGDSVDSPIGARSGAWKGSGIAHTWQNFSQDSDDLPTH